MRAAREGVGKDGDWVIDFHQRFDLPDAIRGCNEIEGLAPFFVEDPVRTEAFLQDLPILRSKVNVPLAAGEEWGNRWDFNPLVERHDIDFVRATLPNVGGITEMMKIAAICETHFVGIVPHFTGPIATAALVNCLGTFSGPVLMEYNYRGTHSAASARMPGLQERKALSQRATRHRGRTRLQTTNHRSPRSQNPSRLAPKPTSGQMARSPTGKNQLARANFTAHEHHRKRQSSALPIRYLLVIWLFVLSAVAYLDRTNISIAGIQIGKEFAIDNTQLGWVFSAFLVGYAAFQVPAGLLVHRFGTRLVLTFAVLWWGLFTVLTALVPARNKRFCHDPRTRPLRTRAQAKRQCTQQRVNSSNDGFRCANAEKRTASSSAE